MSLHSGTSLCSVLWSSFNDRYFISDWECVVSFSAVGVLKEVLDEKAISILVNKKMVNIAVSEVGMTGELEKYFQHRLSIDQMKWSYK